MNKLSRPVFFLLLFTGIASLIVLFMQPLAVYELRDYIALLFPKGIIALKERNLLFILQALMLLIVIPVYIMTFVFAWKYRAGNEKARHDPDLVDHKVAEFFWWGIPLVMTAVVCAITWVKTYELDPFRPIESDKEEMVVQVVALQWKWLFIYPEQGIVSLNFLQIPKERPIRFEITADAPMNSFWIPHLGGQIYAMPKMKSILYLMGDEEGDFRGCSANISGVGFADMHFVTRVSGEEAFADWVAKAKNGSSFLYTDFEELVKPGKSDVALYRLGEEGIFHRIVMKYMHPAGEHVR